MVKKGNINKIVALAAATSVFVGFVGYVYPRDLGELLEERVGRNTDRIKDMDEQNTHRYDHILQILLEIKGQQ